MSENVLRVVRGNPDDAELAALVGVLCALAARGTAAVDPPIPEVRPHAGHASWHRPEREHSGPDPRSWRGRGSGLRF